MVMSYVAISKENTDFYIYNTFQTRYICVQSGTQQAYIPALDGGIENDNLENILTSRDCI